MVERPHSRHTREKTWAALYSQHINAGYALIPMSLTNNSLDVINCKDPGNPGQDLAKDTQAMADLLLKHADEITTYYAMHKTPDKAPKPLTEAILTKKLRSAVVLARSSDYYRYSLEDYPGFNLVICGLHDSYLHIRAWEMRTNRRYKARETAIALKDPDFDKKRCTQTGHNILLAAYAKGDQDAISIVEALPDRTRSRIKRERDAFQDQTYRGRPLAFLDEAKRQEIGSKISASLKRYHANKYLHIV